MRCAARVVRWDTAPKVFPGIPERNGSYKMVVDKIITSGGPRGVEGDVVRRNGDRVCARAALRFCDAEPLPSQASATLCESGRGGEAVSHCGVVPQGGAVHQAAVATVRAQGAARGHVVPARRPRQCV